jgi:hypothetical protein
MLTLPVTRITVPLRTFSDPLGAIVKLEKRSIPPGELTVQSTFVEIVSAPSAPSP